MLVASIPLLTIFLFLYTNSDLKPANVGFNVRDDVTLFDFGLARKMPGGKSDVDDAFEMSGGVGTLRYMSPEVSKGEAYNQSTDVYSFSLLLHEILSLEKPFATMTRGQHKEQVVKGGLRPVIHSSWSRPIQKLMRTGWDANFSVRPSMQDVHRILREEICHVNNWNLEPALIASSTRRRSTFVMQPIDLKSRKSIVSLELTPEESAHIRQATRMLLEARRTSLTAPRPRNKISRAA